MLAVDDLCQHLRAAWQFHLSQDIRYVTRPTSGRYSHYSEAEQDALVAQIHGDQISGCALLAKYGGAKDRCPARVALEPGQGTCTGVFVGYQESLVVY